MNELIATLFLARDIAHKAHLATGSYSQHVALGSFYDGIIDLADKLVEAYQGRTDELLEIPLMDDEATGDIIQDLKKYQDYIEKNRYTAVAKEDAPIQNIIDEIVGLFLSTRYKLTRLK
jgi:hypothetical protein